MKLSVLILLAAATVTAEVSFEAKWKRSARRDVRGVLTFGEDGISFQPARAGRRALSWDYTDIRHFDRIGAAEVAIRGYVGSAIPFGADARYRFRIREGDFDDATHEAVVARIGKPATDRVPRPPEDAKLELPAKHLKRFGGSQGILFVTEDRIVYATDAPAKARSWVIERDVASVWSSDPYRLEVHAFDGREGYLRRPSVYRFALKRPLDPLLYRRLKLKLYEIERRRGPLR